MTLLDTIKKGLTPEKLVATILSGATVAILVTEALATALYTALAIAFMLIVSAAVASVFGRFTAEVGTRIVHLSVSAFTAMVCAEIYAVAEVGVGTDFAFVMAVSAVSGVIVYSCPQKGDGILQTVILSAITAIFFAILLVMTALIREFFGSGAFLGKEVIPHDVPFLLLPAGGLIVLGLIAAFINIIGDAIVKTKSTNVENYADTEEKTDTEAKTEPTVNTEAVTVADIVATEPTAVDTSANVADGDTEDNGDA